MIDWASPTAALATGTLPAPGALRPVSCSVAISAASSAAPRSMCVSTYSGTTSRSAPGNTTRCSTRSTGPPAPCPAAVPVTVPVTGPVTGPVTDSVIGQPRHLERLAAGEERAQPVVVHAQRRPDGHVHVEVRSEE